MPNTTHRIRRQRWVVKAPRTEDAFTLQQRMRQEWEETLLGAFERAFDEAAPGDEVIHLDRLELDFRLAPGQEMFNELPEMIYRQLGEQLRAALGRAGRPYGDIRVTVRTREQDAFEALLHYLRTGSLPWSAANTADAAVADELREACRRDPVRLAAAVREEHASVPFLFRLLQLMDVHELPALVRALLEGAPHATEADVVWMMELLAPAGSDRPGRLQRAAAFLSGALGGRAGEMPGSPERTAGDAGGARDNRTWQDELNELLHDLEETARSFQQLQELIDSATGDEEMEVLLQELRQRMKEDPELQDSLSESLLELLDFGSTDDAGRADDAGDGGDAGADEASKPEDTYEDLFSAVFARAGRAETTDDIGFATAVQNAGAVLLHSFIVPLFTNTGIIEAGSTEIPAHAASRAAAILHFLITGREQVYEFELGIVKLLLGLEPETPLLVAEGLVTDADRAEIDSLLDAVIGYWTALKNTSRDGLRTGFLQRSGLIRATDDGLRLQVEPASFDMLLGSLPWGISIVKLPWMPKPIHVEWERP